MIHMSKETVSSCSEGTPQGQGVKRNQKDSMFGELFSQEKYFIDLYKACCGKTLSPDDIERFDLRSPAVSRPFVNDVSFLTKDNRLLIFIEHQSTNNNNMALRELLYYAESVNLWMTQKNLDLTQPTAIEFPMPEFYVAYNGIREMKHDKSEFENEFLRVKVNFRDINFDRLQEQSPDNSLAGYSYFYKEYRSATAEGVNVEEAFDNARKKCVEKGYLKEIIDKEEFIMMYKPLVNREESVRLGAREEGREEASETMYRVAVKRGVPNDVLADLALTGGISKEKATRIYNEVVGEPDGYVTR